MKLYILMLATLSVISCKNQSNKINSQDLFAGNWIGCGYNKGDIISISKEGDTYIYKDNNSEIIFKSASETILEGMGGLVSLRYEKESMHLKLIDGGPVEEFQKY